MTIRPLGPGRQRVPWDDIVPSIGINRVSVSAAYTVEPGVSCVEADATSGAFSVTLPPLADAYRDIVISKRDASGNAVTVDGDGSETINGATTQALSAQYDAARFTPGATEWILS